jgi:hypothetical protein
MRASESDVSAVVLTLGEATTPEAIRAVEAQTLPPRDIVIVESISPFHRALNDGASRVRTPFFVQVDADMILDPVSFERFRELVAQDTGMVSGFLRDALLGRVCCVKMYRTECFAAFPAPDTVANDTDFRDGILRLGWQIRRALHFDDRGRGNWHTFGEHRREYSPHYTFSKFLIEGRRVRHKRDPDALEGWLTRLRHSRHEMKTIAQIAFAHGIFLEEGGDLLRPFAESDDWRVLERFMSARPATGSGRVALPRVGGDAKGTFRDAYRLGIELRTADDWPAFDDALRLVAEQGARRGCVAQVGLCHGLFADAYDEEILERGYALFQDLIG